MYKWMEIEPPPPPSLEPPKKEDRGVAIIRCCNDPQVRGGRCENCGTWIDDEPDLPQGDNEG